MRISQRCSSVWMAFWVVGALGLWAGGCRPESEVVAPVGLPVTFSEDALVFDTVFTALASVTHYVHVRNPNKNAVRIRSVRLGDAASPYIVTVSGRPSASVRDLDLRGGDSLLVLVRLDVPPRDSIQPFVLYDSLMFDMGGATPNLKLLAWGQDVRVVRPDMLACNQTWEAGQPYLLYDSVAVAPGCKLSIGPGVRVFAFGNAALVVKGTLEARGSAEKPIVFTGYRQDGAYREAPGVWSGLVFLTPARNNLLDHVQIRNAGVAVFADLPDTDSQPDLTLQNVTIQYARQAGLLAVDSDVDATNVRITHCGDFHVAGLGGGTYRLRHCTVVGEAYLAQRDNPALLFATSVSINGAERAGNLVCDVKNTVVSGARTEEVGLMQNSSHVLLPDFGYNILKAVPNALVFNATNQLAVAPGFADARRMDYTPSATSPLKDAGLPLGVLRDITGRLRDARPDIGAYEK